ncbi:MAG TPA: hypothetical protein PLL10_02095 [Elusimicrobiales bacterium]|nr:hypothetical protein [Elusimicrobiales bacterium]
MCGKTGLLLAFTGLLSCGTARIVSPDVLAQYTACDVDNISHWIGQRIEYREQGPVWDSAAVCMARGWGDCKCAATVARDTLNMCAGYEARVVVLRGPRRALHAVAVFTDHKGRRGYINGIGRRLFDPGTAWQDVIQAIPGGPWTEL